MHVLKVVFTIFDKTFPAVGRFKFLWIRPLSTLSLLLYPNSAYSFFENIYFPLPFFYCFLMNLSIDSIRLNVCKYVSQYVFSIVI